MSFLICDAYESLLYIKKRSEAFPPIFLKGIQNLQLVYIYGYEREILNKQDAEFEITIPEGS